MLEHDIQIGAELELEIPRCGILDRHSVPAFVSRHIPIELKELGKVKYDGTIKFGFEFATVPSKANWYCKNGEGNTKKLFKIFRKEKAFVDNHVGMHIHVDKFNLTKEQIQKLVYFVYRNPDFCKIIGEREFNKYCRQQEPCDDEELEMNGGSFYNANVGSKKNHKHKMLNVARYGTIEFRFFKSTNDYNTFLKNMQFVIALVNFVKQSKLKITEWKIGGQSIPSIYDGRCYDVEEGFNILVKEFISYVKNNQATYKQLYSFLKKKKGQIK
jgi:hypothetical protein